MTTHHTNPTDLILINTVADHVANDRFVSALRQLAALRATLEPWEAAARKARDAAWTLPWPETDADANTPTGAALRADRIAAERLMFNRTVADETLAAVRAFAEAVRRIETSVADLATVWERTPAEHLAEHQRMVAQAKTPTHTPAKRTRKA